MYFSNVCAHAKTKIKEICTICEFKFLNQLVLTGLACLFVVGFLSKTTQLVKNLPKSPLTPLCLILYSLVENSKMRVGSLTFVTWPLRSNLIIHLLLPDHRLCALHYYLPPAFSDIPTALFITIEVNWYLDITNAPY